MDYCTTEKKIKDSIVNAQIDHCASVEIMLKRRKKNEMAWHHCSGICKSCDLNREKINIFFSLWEGIRTSTMSCTLMMCEIFTYRTLNAPRFPSWLLLDRPLFPANYSRRLAEALRGNCSTPTTICRHLWHPLSHLGISRLKFNKYLRTSARHLLYSLRPCAEAKTVKMENAWRIKWVKRRVDG